MAKEKKSFVLYTDYIDNAIRYFCGIYWNMIRENNEGGKF